MSGYNGWANYETWCVNLWIENDQGDAGYWQERTQEAFRQAEEDSTFTREEKASFALSKELKESIEENMPEVQGMYSDMLISVIGRVDYREIAAAWVSKEKAEVLRKEAEEE